MPDLRANEIEAFLADTPAAGATRKTLAGDASLRRYDRLTLAGGGTLVLMDAPPGSGEDIRPFARIARWLAGAGLSAPKIVAEDPKAGLLLLEDLGDALYSEVVTAQPEMEAPLYAAATDLLAELQRVPPPAGLATYDTALLTDLAALAWRWYRLDVAHKTDTGAPFRQTFADLLRRHAGPPGGVALRDFHAQNLIWLPDRAGAARVGLLDFQDAMLAPAVYDLVSLLTDARRDVPRDLAEDMTARFAAQSKGGQDEIRAACAVVGLQRNLRILGVFARLSLHFGKLQYIDLIPRVWTHIQCDLAHPVNAPIRDLVATLPAPDPGHLNELRERCGTIPTR